MLEYSLFVYCLEHLLQAKNQRMTSVSSVPSEIEIQLIREKELHDVQLNAKSLSLNHSIGVYVNKLNELTNLLSPVQAYIIEKSLNQWKRQQQLAGNGYKYLKDIDVIQTWLVLKVDKYSVKFDNIFW